MKNAVVGLLLLTGTFAEGVGQTVSSPLVYELPGGTKLTLEHVPPGTFQMGEPGNRFAPRRQVTITRDYYVGETEVTQAQWWAVMGNVPYSSQPQGSAFPVGASADDVDQFLAKANSLLGLSGSLTLRLPTEAEWERAMRGGTDTRFPFGDAGECAKPGEGIEETCPLAEDHAWYVANSKGGWHQVAMKKPNAYGLFDMLGNAAELVHDWYGDPSGRAETNPTGPKGPTIGRVSRGGDWRFGLRATTRGGPIAPFHRDSQLGFRVTRSR